MFGNAHTHDRLIREIAAGPGAAVVFPDYDRSPEARHPVALEQNYAAARWIVAHGAEHDLDASRLAIAGDSGGGNTTAAVTILAKQRGDVTFRRQVLFYPVTDASFDTGSYRQFATGYFLACDGMTWGPGPARRSPPHRCGRAWTSWPALVITAEADVLRDEGEAYANKLRRAGVPVTAVRYQSVIHDFVMLNALRGTNAAEAAIARRSRC
ncbi:MULTISPECIES: alpha/beta hydrolase [Amycolatopsis]|uniref:alpha/beta hydrolase n=1 Tax=Amycolatopsis TaxID=1813 RepID=UPI0013046B05|nr:MULTISPECIES: alpha/beta hydrolase [Amycolatopsis]